MPAASAAIVPINWQELYLRLPARSAQRRVLDEAVDFGLRGGITVPVHGPGQGFATMNVAANVPDSGLGELWPPNRHLLHMIALYTTQAVTRLSTGGAPKPDPQPTPREPTGPT